MSDTTLYTLREIAQQLNLPESTVRYHRDAFASHLTTVGTGRRRRYPAEAVAVLRTIAEGYAAGMTRDAIEHSLAGDWPVEGPRPTHVASPDMDAEDLLSTILDGERERREAMWQMAQEILRLGEAIERQHVILGSMAERLDAAPLTLPPGAPGVREFGAEPEPVRERDARPAAARPTVDEGSLASELKALRDELESERALVERLRKSKLEIERRAADAEAKLDAKEEPASSLFGRLLRRSERGGGP